MVQLEYGIFIQINYYKKIIIYKKRILGICLWSNNYLFIGYEDKTIKLLEIKSEEIVNNLFGNNSTVLNIKKINHPKYGECLISQGAKDNQIKLWIKKIKKKKKKLNQILLDIVRYYIYI